MTAAYRLRLDNYPHRSQLVELGPVEVLAIHIDTDADTALAALKQRYPVNVPEAVRDELVRRLTIVHL